jgi:carbamoyltransferase
VRGGCKTGLARCFGTEPGPTMFPPLPWSLLVVDVPYRLQNVLIPIRAGKAGAIYVGRMEFGPRALGNRSIIASPQDHAINDILNKRLDRSEFMPFAPYVLQEDAEPVVVHVDGTARPQIVRDQTNPFAAILPRFRDSTGLPVLINTSFDVHESRS